MSDIVVIGDTLDVLCVHLIVMCSAMPCEGIGEVEGMQPKGILMFPLEEERLMKSLIYIEDTLLCVEPLHIF